jgi:hypothetical protein
VIIYKEFHHGFIGKIEKPSLSGREDCCAIALLPKGKPDKKCWYNLAYYQVQEVEGGTHSGFIRLFYWLF